MIIASWPTDNEARELAASKAQVVFVRADSKLFPATILHPVPPNEVLVCYVRYPGTTTPLPCRLTVAMSRVCKDWESAREVALSDYNVRREKLVQELEVLDDAIDALRAQLVPEWAKS